MPTYLCHGFRWKRQSIRVFVVVQDLDDAAPEWIIKRGSAQSLIGALYSLFDFLPECTYPPEHPTSAHMHHATRTGPVWSISQARAAAAQQDHQDPYYYAWDQEDPTGRGPRRQSSTTTSSSTSTSPSQPLSHPQFPASDHESQGEILDPVLSQGWSPVKLLEEYDPNNLKEVSRPYAYVADYVQRIDSSCSIIEEIVKYEQQVRENLDPERQYSREVLNGERGTGWFEQLRYQLQRDEEIKWYVVVNGDEERNWPVFGTGPKLDTADIRAQTAYHVQHTHQQSVLDSQDRDTETRRQQLRRELGYEEGGIKRPLVRKPVRQPVRQPVRKSEREPKVQETDVPELPPLRMNVPVHPGGASRPRTPKSPGKAFRRLFGRLKTGEIS